jgi:nitronate monooxygenase
MSTSWWSRRRIILASAAASAGSLLPDRAGAQNSRLRTPLLQVLGIDLPLLQAPMSGVVTPALVAAVSNSGGLGLLPGIMVPPDQLRQQIGAIRNLTSRPFGVNLLLHRDLQPPVDPAAIPDDVVGHVQGVLNRFRERLGIPAKAGRPPRPPDLIAAALDIIIEERVPVFSIGLGSPPRELVDRCHRAGIRVIAMAATVDDARELGAAGVDAIIAQGSEAGGHRSTWTKRPSPQHAAVGTLALVPQVVAAVSVPVIAAGGIVDGRGLAAALVAGASGVSLGTRFIATQESAAPAFYKQALLDASGDDTVVTDVFTGLYARVLRNEFTETYGATGAPVFPAVVQQLATIDIAAASAAESSGSFYPMYAGQGCGAVRDLPTVGALISRTMEEARRALGESGASGH